MPESSSPEVGPVGPDPEPLDPRIVELLEREADFPERPVVEAEIRAKVPTLRATFPVEWIVSAIIVALAARRAKKIKTSFAAFVEGVLNKSIDNGKVELRGAKPPPKPPEQVEAERRAAAEQATREHRTKVEAERRAAAIDRAVKALDPATLATLSTEFDALHLDFPGPARNAFFKVWLREAVEAKGVAS